jgi:4-aminobutyrate aminotransferase/(S)-3-amino-2-methylpropionate transaminase
VVEAVKTQIDKFSHTCVMVNPYEVAVELAEKLIDIAPGESEKKAIFVTTGAEAVENCVKIARAHTGRRGVIAFNGGFHGRTNLTMALTGKITPYKNLFGPFPGDIFHAPFPIDCHEISVKDSLKAVENLFKVDIAPADVAAIIIEPVQGEGGFYSAPTEFLVALRKICDEHGIVLIADEIQSGFGRTGKMFNMEYSGVEPDLITMAKGIAGGFPISAIVGKSDIMDAPLPGGLGGTYGGSPVACAAALAVLDIIKEENLIQRSNEIGDLFNKALTELKNQHPKLILDVRNKGTMIALELIENGDAEQPNSALTQAIIANAAKYGLVLLACGFYGNVIRFLPALTISNEIAEEGLAKFSELFNELAK